MFSLLSFSVSFAGAAFHRLQRVIDTKKRRARSAVSRFGLFRKGDVADPSTWLNEFGLRHHAWSMQDKPDAVIMHVRIVSFGSINFVLSACFPMSPAGGALKATKSGGCLLPDMSY